MLYGNTEVLEAYKMAHSFLMKDREFTIIEDPYDVWALDEQIKGLSQKINNNPLKCLINFNATKNSILFEVPPTKSELWDIYHDSFLFSDFIERFKLNDYKSEIRDFLHIITEKESLLATRFNSIYNKRQSNIRAGFDALLPHIISLVVDIVKYNMMYLRGVIKKMSIIFSSRCKDFTGINLYSIKNGSRYDYGYIIENYIVLCNYETNDHRYIKTPINDGNLTLESTYNDLMDNKDFIFDSFLSSSCPIGSKSIIKYNFVYPYVFGESIIEVKHKDDNFMALFNDCLGENFYTVNKNNMFPFMKRFLSFSDEQTQAFYTKIEQYLEDFMNNDSIDIKRLIYEDKSIDMNELLDRLKNMGVFIDKNLKEYTTNTIWLHVLISGVNCAHLLNDKLLPRIRDYIIAKLDIMVDYLSYGNIIDMLRGIIILNGMIGEKFVKEAYQIDDIDKIATLEDFMTRLIYFNPDMVSNNKRYVNFMKGWSNII